MPTVLTMYVLASETRAGLKSHDCTVAQAVDSKSSSTRCTVMEMTMKGISAQHEFSGEFTGGIYRCVGGIHTRCLFSTKVFFWLV